MDQKRYDPSGDESSLPKERDAWAQLRGALKDVFAESGGGEAYLHSERTNFFTNDEGQ
jgi:hypothetical protein